MKQKWLNRYREAGENLSFDSKVLLGFNCNIDVLQSFEELSLDLEDIKGEELRRISSRDEFRKVLKFSRTRERNLEVSIENLDIEIEGEERIGGQAGIMSNFLSRIGNRSVLYTPFLSEDLSELIDPEVVYPVADENLTLQSVPDAVNSDRTKRNYIVESEDVSSRVILSDHIRGFGAYFRKGVEEKFPEMQESIDRAILSGFHDVEGNFESKLRKAEKQLRKIHVPTHLEFVSTTHERDEMILGRIASCFTSIGMDESELKRIADILGYSIEEEPSLGDVYSISKKIIQKYNMSRVHVHTKNFQAVVADRKYPVKDTRIRESMLFGCLAANSMAEIGKIPEREDIGINEENMHVKRLDDLEHFEEFFNLDNFAETGTARLEDYKVVAIPTLIHEEPEKLVGMGDLISSGAFIGETH
jgi:ADP-dependent phosphofructokinase/glucokinase